MDDATRLRAIIETCGEVLERLRAVEAPDTALIADVERLRAESEALLAALAHANPPKPVDPA